MIIVSAVTFLTYVKTDTDLKHKHWLLLRAT